MQSIFREVLAIGRKYTVIIIILDNEDKILNLEFAAVPNPCCGSNVNILQRAVIEHILRNTCSWTSIHGHWFSSRNRDKDCPRNPWVNHSIMAAGIFFHHSEIYSANDDFIVDNHHTQLSKAFFKGQLAEVSPNYSGRCNLWSPGLISWNNPVSDWTSSPLLDDGSECDKTPL